MVNCLPLTDTFVEEIGFFYLSHYILTVLSLLTSYQSGFQPLYPTDSHFSRGNRPPDQWIHWPISSPHSHLLTQHWNPNVIYSTALCSPPSSFPFPPNNPSSLVTDPFPQLSILPLGLSYKTDSQRFPCLSKPQANLSNCLCYIATGVAHWHSTAALIVLSPNLYILVSDAASSQHPKPGSEYYLFPFVSLPCLISN